MGRKPSTIVIHCTAGSNLVGAEETLRKNGYGYHYIIEPNGNVWKGCPTSGKVSHAGDSVGPEGRYCNAYSIGVCMVNLNNGKDPYDKAQLASLDTLIGELADAIPEIKYLTGHYQIAPSRKSDPKGFDFRPLAKKYGLEAWKLPQCRWIS